MTSTETLELYAGGRRLDTSANGFGWLLDSRDAKDDPVELRLRMARDGYLYLPAFFDRADVLDVRKSLTDALLAEGALDPGYPAIDAIVRDGVEMGFRPDIANGNNAVEDLLYGSLMMDWIALFLGGPARHYDYTWLRAVSPGHGTSPHCDIVYMGRGTSNLYTAWVPLGDVPLHVGGLLIMEQSHLREDLRNTYGTLDVDAACENHPDSRNQVEAQGFHESGAIDTDPVGLRARLGGRWLTAEYRMGDLLLFSMFTIHASLDNHSREIRLSSDSRYQLASDPVDERWVGDHPIGHGPNAKKSLIC
jgi:hypothetical protein